MRYREFERIISEDRMNRYVQACGGNTRKAMALYRYNLRLSQEMFTIISCFEVSLRNAINVILINRFGNDWLMQFNQTGRVLLRAFPNKERSTSEVQHNHSYFFNELDKINTMRNRIAHHEPVCFYLQDAVINTSHVLGIYSKMQTLFTWMGIDSRALLYGLDHVQQVCMKINELKDE